MRTILAHEKWFADQLTGSDWTFATQPMSIALLAGAVVIAIVWRRIDRRLPRPEIGALAPLGRFAPWVPRLLAIHAGVSLLAQASRGSYLAPSLSLPDGAPGTLLAVLEGLVGVWLITGFRIRWGAALLVAAGPIGMIAYGPVAILERADLLGIAVFLALLPPADDPAGAVPVDPAVVARAVWALRVLVGVALLVVAFTEKLAGPDLAFDFLARYPALNLADAVGIGISDATFVRIAGAVEVLFGLLLISGAAPQAVVIVAGVPFNATLFFLGTLELIGHLPIYGAMLALLVYGSNGDTAPRVRDLWPGRARTPVRS